MKFPKSLIIGGVKWSIKFDRKITGGGFYWKEHCIVIRAQHTEERKYEVLIHEICEIIMTNNVMRFAKCFAEISNGDYLFSFDHDRFEIFTDELAGILRHQLKNRIR
jgi:hypothetical protein